MQAQQAAHRDEASEVPPRANGVEVPAAAHILVGGLLDVLALSTAHIRHRSLAAATASDAASCALLPCGNSAAVAIGTASDNSPNTTSMKACRAAIGSATVGPSREHVCRGP